ncbi:MAG TPA: hypothetical protein PLI45_00295 [Candidatus Woesebacteria bacterium]|nr:hypothetical protein [Candidatus Woesebacteria bacterium]
MDIPPDTLRNILSTISQGNYRPFDKNDKIINDFDGFILIEPKCIMIHKVVVKRILGIFKTTVYKEVAILSLPEHDGDPWIIRKGVYLNDHDILPIKLLVTVIESQSGIHIKYG